ncbi:MAG TPA: 4-(cytidine 5'-diphospho)-2-C-methyl-D-erythritol kinase [Propionibacteriaceae bacterium]|nr:4-(cytidine 5'-diphospho)-2-C-methyl-D-erythritol kinase [Propionibacteriaceae bacterium]
MVADERTGRGGVRVRVPAKINLALCVGPLGADGFHPLGTAFQAVSLYDEVTATDAKADHFSVTVTGEGAGDVPTDDTNLAIRAARLLATHERGVGAKLSIKKTIPVAGGMAGGSADGAAALLACSVLWDLDQSLEDLQVLGAELGSDVPFPLHGGTAIGTRRGDRLLAMLTRGTYHWVLAFAHGGLSTPAVFRRFDELGVVRGTEVPPELLNALAVGDAVALGRALRNDLQPAAVDLRPELAETLEAGLDAGALGGLVSGSGPTCAFLAATEARALDIAAHLSRLPQVRGTKLAVGPVPGAKLLP